MYICNIYVCRLYKSKEHRLSSCFQGFDLASGLSPVNTVPFRIVRRSRVTVPPDGAEIGLLSRVTLSLAGRDIRALAVFINARLINGRNLSMPKFEFAEKSAMSRIPLASAEVKFRRIGHGSQAMPNNSKWYSSLITIIFIQL